MGYVHRAFRVVLLFLPLCVSSGAAFAEDSSEERFEPSTTLRELPVQHDGRIKPLETYAREMLWQITGKGNFSKAKVGKEGEETVVFPDPDPVRSLLLLQFRSGEYADRPLIYVPNKVFKETIGVPTAQSHFSWKEVQEWIYGERKERFREWYNAARTKRQEERESEIRPEEQAAEEIWGRYSLFDTVVSGGNFAILPVPVDGTGRWLSVQEARKRLLGEEESPHAHPHPHPEGEGETLSQGTLLEFANVFQRFGSAMAAGEHEKAHEASIALVEYLKPMYLSLSDDPNFVPAERLATEVRYDQGRPFQKAWLFYFAAFCLFLIALGYRAGWFYALPMLLTLGGLGFHLLGFAQRWIISGHIPLSNLYEALIFVCLGAVLIGLVFEGIYRSRYFGLVATFVAAIGMILADSFTSIFNPHIAPLVPALKSYWMNYHVSSMLLGYAAGWVAMGLGHIYLFVYLLFPSARERLRSLNLFMYRSIQVATLFIGIGLMLGAVWAGEAWGRWWGWDPKETWALITFFGYIVILHARFSGWIGGVGTAVGAVLSFALIMMTFYGVNLIGKGLHSYGFFEGGFTPLLLYLGAEMLLLGGTGIAYWIRKTAVVR